MRTPDEILGQIRTRYEYSWRDWLTSPPDGLSFPLAPPNAQTIARDATTVAAWLRTWRSWVETHPTIRLRTATRRTVIGPQQIYTHLDLPDANALAAVDPETQAHWHTATRRYPRLVDLGGPREQFKPHLQAITNLSDDDFALLLRVIRWFNENPRSELTIRQVPVVGMHTKWLARHRGLVHALLRISSDQSAPPETAIGHVELTDRDLDLLGLRPLPITINVILTDPCDQHRLAGIRHLNAPLEEIANLPLRPHQVLIVENKESALPIADLPGLIVIHSLGNYLGALSAIPWVSAAQTWYWGDLDRAGFTLLSRARTRILDITSIMMDSNTLDKYISLAVNDPTGRVDPPDRTLTNPERETLAALRNDGNPLRLEQERIPWTYVQETLLAALSGSR
ncbi:Wadjet anti-phage system protein JetD domain-containing protein [Fodinicola acaciae]|uniref:Wadjet anti-phage system protein JetD domain-containing protein n=1 Tax=Fodinicola acaciae TaxID=2681555 RepID=UPI0013CFE09D|nr:Wadjet anti-phage system protein JetD domain-containing protein [Fodinicola acaciae]